MDRDPIIAGQVVTFGAPFVDDTGTPEDPSNIIFLLQIGNAQFPNQYVYGIDVRVVRDGKGLYHIDIDTTGMGGLIITGEWATNGTGKTIGYKALNIRNPAIPSPYPASIDPATSDPPNAFIINPLADPAPNGYVLTEDSAAPLGYQWLPVAPSGALPLTGGTMSGAIAMGANKITGLTNGTSAQDAVTVEQLGAETTRAEAQEAAIAATVAVREVAAWAASTSYAVGQFVSFNGGFYQAPGGGVPSRSVFTAGDWIHVADINLAIGTTSSTVAAGNAPAAAQAAAEAASDPSGTAAGLVATETSRAETAEATKASTSALSSEASTRAAADTTLTTNLAAEVTRAEAAEALLAHSTTVASEVTRAEGAEATIAANLAAETTRAEAAEATKASASALATETSRAEGVEATKASTTALTTETGRAETAEGTLTTAISTETTRAEAAEALKLAKASNLSDVASPSTSRTNLGLGTAATHASTDFDASGAATAAVATETTRAEAAEALKLPKAGGTMTGPIVLPGNPSTSLQAAPKQYVDAETTRAEGAETTLTTNLAAETTRAEAAEALGLLKSGGTMTGAIVLPGNPSAALQAAPQQYVDAEETRALAAEEAVQTNLNNEVTRAEGVEAGLTSGLASEVARAEAAEAAQVAVAGDTMTGPLVLPGDPTTNLQAATKHFVDLETTRAEAAEADLVNISGSTMTGELLLPGNPVDALAAVPKQYVDGVATGLSVKNPVEALAASNLASLSGLSTIDGYSTAPADRVLLVGQSNALQDGIWVVATGAWTRPVDFASGSVEDGVYVLVNNGAVYQGTGFILTGSTTVDISAETWTQFSSNTEVSAGTGISKTGNVIANTGVLTFNGRSGTVVPTSGDYTAAQVGADATGAGTTAAAAVQTTVLADLATETTRAETAEALALLKANNLSDVASPGMSRSNIHVTPLAAAQVVSTANQTLTGNPTIDGYTLAATDLVLLTNQTTTTQNGQWLIPTGGGAWTRPTDFSAGLVLTGGRSCLVMKGTVNANTMWILDVATAGITVDTSAQTWVSHNVTGTVTTASTISAVGNLVSARLTSGGNNISLDGTTSPPSIAIPGGGRIWASAGLPSVVTGAATVGDIWYDTAQAVFYNCITAGTPGTWQLQQNTVVTTTAGPGATPTVNVNTGNYYNFTAMAAAITGITVTGSPSEGDILTLCFTDNGTARAITHGASFEASTISLVTTTVISTKVTEVFTYNGATSKFRLSYKY